MKNATEAGEHYLKAISLYSAHFAKSLEYAHCLHHFGVFLSRNGNKTEAIAQIEEALNLFLNNKSQENVDGCKTLLQQLRTTSGPLSTSFLSICLSNGPVSADITADMRPCGHT